MAESSNELIEKFEKTYHLNKTIKEMEDMMDRFRDSIDSFRFDTPTGRDADRLRYVKSVKYLIDRHMEYATRFDKNVSIDQLDMTVMNLVRDYEEIIQRRHEEQHANDGVTRVPYEGIHRAVMDTVAKTVQPHNKRLPEIWSKAIIKNKINLEAAQTETREVLQMAQEKNGVLDEAEQRAVENTVMMYRAMQQVASKRSFIWSILPWNWNRANQEEAYLNELKDQMAAYEELGISVHAIESNAKYVSPIFGENFGQMIESTKEIYRAQRQAARKAAQSQEKEKVSGIDLNPVQNPVNNSKNNVHVTENVIKRTGDMDYMIDLAKEIANALPQSVSSSRRYHLVKTKLPLTMNQTVQAANMAFDKGEVPAKEVVQQMTIDIYKKSMTLVDLCEYQGYERFVAAQIITDKMMQKLSPAAFYEKEYGEFANGYILNHAQEVNSKLSAKEQIPETQLENAKQLYSELVPEKIQVGLENNQAGAVSQPVSAPAINAPNLSSTK